MYIITKHVDYDDGTTNIKNLVVSTSIDTLMTEVPKGEWEDSQNGYLMLEVNEELTYRITEIKEI